MTANETPLDLERLWEVAVTANEGSWETYELPDAGPNRWTMTGVGVVGDEMGHRIEAMFHTDAEVVATFDPPAVLALIERLERAEAAVERVRALADEWERHATAFSAQLEDALDGPR